MSNDNYADSTEYRIAHLFADYGVESEVLSRVGTVTRYTIDPRPNPSVAETVQMDLMEETPDQRFHLAFLHPKCTRWSDMPNVDPESHEDQIPRARELAEEIADDYVIENKPRAPLRDPVVLEGRMFGLPLAYERAFETTFPVTEPARHRTFGDKTVSPYFLADRTREWWEVVKGYSGEYPKQHLAKNALPAAYVGLLLRAWLESLDTRDAKEVQDNNSPAPPKPHPQQATLGGGNGD